MAPKKIRAVIERFKRALRQAGFPMFRVVVFGSYARGEARPDSDVDVCLVSPAFKSAREKYRKQATLIAFGIDPRIQVITVDPGRLKTDRLSPLYSRIRKEGIAA